MDKVLSKWYNIFTTEVLTEKQKEEFKDDCEKENVSQTEIVTEIQRIYCIVLGIL